MSQEPDQKPTNKQTIAELTAKLEEWKNRAEQAETQLAGCGVAALGWNQEPAKQGDWGWSAPYQDVLTLRQKYELLTAKRKLAEDESAWLIERGPLCLGFCEYRFTWVTFTNEDALRFSRKRDAYSFVESMKWQTKTWGENLKDVSISEHMWCNGNLSILDAPTKLKEERNDR